MSDWDATIRRAGFDIHGRPLSAERPADLEFCVQPPRVWFSDARGQLCLRWIGWAVSFSDENLRVRVADSAGTRRWLRPVRSRPDVLKHYRRRGAVVSEFSGFDFLLDLDTTRQGATCGLEILSDSAGSGSLDVDAAALYLRHRAALGHDRPYLGVFEPAPETRGRLDEARGARIRGWAQSLDSVEPVVVVLYLNGQPLAEAYADCYREDLVHMRISESGRHAFEFELARELKPGDVVRVTVRDGLELTNSPLTVG